MTFRNALTVSFLLICLSASVFAQPSVVSVSPTPQIITAAPDAVIMLTFDQPINPTTVNSSTVRAFGHWSGPALGSYSLSSGNTVVEFTPNDPFFVGEWVMVSVSNEVESQSGTPMTTGYSWGFWIATEFGLLDLVLKDVIPVRQSGEGHIQVYGAYGGDFNQDGYSDLACPNELTNDVRVFLNDGSGGYGPFSIVPLANGSVPSPNEGGDFNNDGIIDLVVGSGGNDQVHIMTGNGAGGFPSVDDYTAAQAVRGVAVIDLNCDGHDDIVTANRIGNNISLFLNDGSGNFGLPTTINTPLVFETACVATDANNDGLTDIFVGGYSSSEIGLFLGDGFGGLTLSDRISVVGQPWMLAAGDINGDGNADVAAASSSGNNIAVVFGDGAGGIDSAVSYPSGSFPIAIDLGDMDGDGDLDVMSSNYLSANFILHENDGSGVYINPRTYNASSAGSCATFHDRDNDGDLDITNIDETDDLIFLFENLCEPLIDADTIFGPVPLAVQFDGSSCKTPTNWSWDFADGDMSTASSDLHTFNQPGLFQVVLTVEATDSSIESSKPTSIYVHSDTIVVTSVVEQLGQPIRVDLSVRNFVPLTDLTIPFTYAGPLDLTFDSISTAGTRTDYFGLATLLNVFLAQKRATIGLSLTGGQQPLPPGDGVVVSLFFTAENQIEDSNPIEFSDYASYTLEFETIPGAYRPSELNGSVTLIDNCCNGHVGDANGMGGDEPTVADIGQLIDFLFITGSPLPCVAEADANQSGGANPVPGDVTIADIGVLIDYQFVTGTPLADCP